MARVATQHAAPHARRIEPPTADAAATCRWLREMDVQEQEVWKDAGLESVIQYLLGSKYLDRSALGLGA